jgi:hypothetical protein
VSVVYMDDEGQPTKTGGVIPQSTIMRELHIKVNLGFVLPCLTGAAVSVYTLGVPALQSCVSHRVACGPLTA